jgi:hypothetical protein
MRRPVARRDALTIALSFSFSFAFALAFPLTFAASPFAFTFAAFAFALAFDAADTIAAVDDRAGDSEAQEQGHEDTKTQHQVGMPSSLTTWKCHRPDQPHGRSP